VERVLVHIISRKKLVEFWEKHPQSKGPLSAWYSRTRVAHWTMFADVRHDYPSADQVGRFVVFNVGGNKYRLIVVIHYNRQKVYIRHVLTHGEYDEDDWKND
jgi:mRNA interferase HigB